MRRTSPPKRGRQKRPPPDEPAHEVAAPPALQALTFRVGRDEFAVLSFPAAPLEAPHALSEAERQIVAAVLQGKSNEDIARERGTSARTVANQIQNVFGKLSVTSRAELAARLANAWRFES